MFTERFLKEFYKSKLRQNELAAQVGVSEALISRFLNGSRRPSFEVLCKIADIFDCSTDYLLGRVDTPWGHILTCEEKLTFLPPELTESLEIRINGKEVTPEIQKQIMEELRTKGLIK